MATIETLLQFLLIITTLVIIFSKNNLKIIIFFSASSLITASLYFFNKAPDVALAEVAIGSAITPLIFLMAITRQKDFVVINRTEDDFFNKGLSRTGDGYRFLEKFTEHYQLKLSIYNKKLANGIGVLRSGDVDLTIQMCPSTKKYLLKGKESNILMNKLEQMALEEPLIEILKVRGEISD